jgi:hypothetical protein
MGPTNVITIRYFNFRQAVFFNLNVGKELKFENAAARFTTVFQAFIVLNTCIGKEKYYYKCTLLLYFEKDPSEQSKETFENIVKWRWHGHRGIDPILKLLA